MTTKYSVENVLGRMIQARRRECLCLKSLSLSAVSLKSVTVWIAQVDLWCVRRAAGFSCTEPPAGVTAARSDTNTECTPEFTT